MVRLEIDYKIKKNKKKEMWNNPTWKVSFLLSKAHMRCWKLSKFIRAMNIKESSFEWFEWWCWKWWWLANKNFYIIYLFVILDFFSIRKEWWQIWNVWTLEMTIANICVHIHSCFPFNTIFTYLSKKHISTYN